MNRKKFASKEEAAVRLGLTIDQFNVMASYAWAVYEETAPDMEEGRPRRGWPRSMIIEVVLDANRLEQLIKRTASEPTKSAILAALQMDYEKFLIPAFGQIFRSSYYE